MVCLHEIAWSNLSRQYDDASVQQRHFVRVFLDMTFVIEFHFVKDDHENLMS